MIQTVLSRRALFGAADRREAKAVRPPSAVDEGVFLDACTDCAACLDVCPQAIIVADETARPVLDFSLGACTFCGACTDVCPTGALDGEAARPWTWRARIGASCLSYNGVTCRTCGDACEAGAIRFRLLAGGRDIPFLDTEACTGCGACKAVCPVEAVTFSEHAMHVTEYAT